MEARRSPALRWFLRRRSRSRVYVVFVVAVAFIVLRDQGGRRFTFWVGRSLSHRAYVRRQLLLTDAADDVLLELLVHKSCDLFSAGSFFLAPSMDCIVCFCHWFVKGCVDWRVPPCVPLVRQFRCPQRVWGRGVGCGPAGVHPRSSLCGHPRSSGVVIFC